MITRDMVLQSSRLAGDVRRYHTWSVLRPQTNADHTWNCLRIYLQTFKYISPHVTEYIVFHDCGELRTGDLPFPVKMNNPELKRIIDEEEQKCLAGMGVTLPVLALAEKLRVRYCDLMDMHEYGLLEMRLGNQFAKPIVEDTRKALDALYTQMPAGDCEFVLGYLTAQGLLSGVEK